MNFDFGDYIVIESCLNRRLNEHKKALQELKDNDSKDIKDKRTLIGMIYEFKELIAKNEYMQELQDLKDNDSNK